MDLIGKIYPTSSKGHNFILVAIDYFTKWVEAVPLKKGAEGCDLIHQGTNHHRFGIPQSITTDRGTMFTRDEMTYFSKDWHSTHQIHSLLCPRKWVGRSF